MSSTMTA